MPASTRLALPYPVATDTADVPRDIKALTDKLDPNTAVDYQGTLAARPAAGTVGRYYYATDTQTLYRDTGSAWAAVGGGGAVANPGYLTKVATGANVSLNADQALTGLSIAFTTPPYPVDADVQWSCRIDNGGGATWYWTMTHVVATPAPVSQAQGAFATLAATSTAGQTFFVHTGHDRLALAASTAYTIGVWAGPQIAGGSVWNAAAGNHVSARLFAR